MTSSDINAAAFGPMRASPGQAHGKPTAAQPGADEPNNLLKTTSKAVFAWQALFPTPYTAKLLEFVYPLNDSRRGWYAGRFEADSSTNGSITANANAVPLESLH
ncbi:MAG: DUF3131 domain-containing protein [Geminicoccaceae bacterium]